jgi:hypothetical protein
LHHSDQDTSRRRGEENRRYDYAALAFDFERETRRDRGLDDIEKAGRDSPCHLCKRLQKQMTTPSRPSKKGALTSIAARAIRAVEAVEESSSTVKSARWSTYLGGVQPGYRYELELASLTPPLAQMDPL